MNWQNLQISPERRQIVIRDIAEGSEPEFRFYLMVAISTMIASFGLIINSTAVIIGAMLVAPLMTPIFGIALALIRSDARLFGRALTAEIVGVVAAIAMSLVIGLLYPALEPTPEMIARTEPQLFDLLVAVFAGLAGAYALVDEKISPALPGVAIATAIVPPLANVGLCFSVGQYVAGVGSFLLFFANFLSILLVASAVFWIFGMAGSFSGLDKKAIINRFGLPIICFVLVAAFLTRTLVDIAQNHYLNEAIETALENELSNFPDTSLERIRYDEQDGTIYVLVDLQSSRVITPNQVSLLEKSIQNSIDSPAKLIVRSKDARQILALGSDVLRAGKTRLDGSFIKPKIHPRVRDTKIADNLIRNSLAKLLGYELYYVRVFQIGETQTIHALIYGINPPSPKTIEEMESKLKVELDNPNTRLIVSFIETRLYDRKGSFRLEFSGLDALPPEQEASASEIVGVLKNEIEKDGEIYISGINYNIINDTLHMLIETKGKKLFSQNEVAKFERLANDVGSMPIKLFVIKQEETVTMSDGYKPYPLVSRELFIKQESLSKESIQKIIEASNY